MTHYRKIIKPSDPKVSIRLPQEVYENLKSMAVNNVRQRISEEIVARLIATLPDRHIPRDEPLT